MMVVVVAVGGGNQIGNSFGFVWMRVAGTRMLRHAVGAGLGLLRCRARVSRARVSRARVSRDRDRPAALQG